MFVFSLKWNKKAALIVLIAIALLLAILVLVFGRSTEGNELKIDSAEDASEFLYSLGWTVDSNSIEEKTIIIPSEFSAVYEEYNDLQIANGYDLGDYRGNRVIIYTFRLHDYPDYNGDVVSDIYVYKGKVIGGDIHSLELDGFMHGLCNNSN